METGLEQLRNGNRVRTVKCGNRVRTVKCGNRVRTVKEWKQG